MNNLGFAKPVYPEDVLYVKAKKCSGGGVTILFTTYKNDGTQVLKAEMSALVAK